MFKRKLKFVSNAVKTVGLNDLSAGLSSKQLGVDELSRYGIAGKVTAAVHDPVQSLLAVATSTREIHVYGQQQVEVVFSLSDGSTVEHLHFVKGVYLVGVDQKGNIMVFSLLQRKLLYSVLAPGKPTAVEADPALDWLLLGMANGTVLAFDVDRGHMTSFGIENLQKQALPKERLSGVVSIEWNPRDIGTVLIGYNHCAVVYSMATGEIRTSFHYEVPAGAPGGDGLITGSPRYPKLIKALYHPNSLNAVTLHDDGSLVFWDALTGKLILARTLFDSDVNLPSGSRHSNTKTISTQISQINWITFQNPDDTALLITSNQGHTLTCLHFGTAPKYSITSYEKMNHYYSNPKRQFVLPFKNQSQIEFFVPLATSSPFFNGNDNPEYLLLILKSGEVEILDFPQGTTNYNSFLFPQSLAWVHPKTTVSIASIVPRKQWMGIISKSSRKDSVLKGGHPVSKPLRSTEVRSALITGHANGYVRLWDASHGELDDSSVIDIDVGKALGSEHDVAVKNVSFAGESAELTVGLENGDVVLFKFDVNQRFDPSKSERLESLMGKLNLNSTGLIDLHARAPNIREGFLPVCALLSSNKGKSTAVNNSNIGFVAIAYQNGDLVIIDRRGPAIIFNENIIGYSKDGRSSQLTSLEFSIMSYGDDSYSSILLFGGSDNGELYTYKILPEASGRFTAQLIDVVLTNESKITNILPYRLDNGTPSIATFDNFNKLADGILIQGAIGTVSGNDIRIVTPGRGKSSHKIFNHKVLSAGISIVQTNNPSRPYASVFSVVLSSNTVKILSNPELKEIASLSLPFGIDPSWGIFSSVLSSGDIIIRINETEAELVSIIGTGKQLYHSPTDKIFNEGLKIPYRPTIGTVQWIKGTTLITYNDLDLLIGGDKRPESKNFKESEFSRGNVTLTEPTNPSKSEEFAYTKPVRKRTSGGYDPTRFIVHSFQNGVESMEESFNEYANSASQSMNESIGAAKKDLVSSIVKSKFGI